MLLLQTQGDSAVPNRKVSIVQTAYSLYSSHPSTRERERERKKRKTDWQTDRQTETERACKGLWTEPHLALLYLLRAPPNGQVWHNAFFGGSGRRAVAHTRPAFPKNAYSPVGIPLIRGASGAGRLIQPKPLHWVTHTLFMPQRDLWISAELNISTDNFLNWFFFKIH